jgi:hypothetical protein
MTTLDEYLARLELKRLVLRCSRFDARVCPTRMHQGYWVYHHGKWLCLACIKLSEWIA